MRAWSLQQPKPVDERPLALVEVPEPKPGEHELLIRVRVCGVCHTDLHVVEGILDLPMLPVVPGHQIVGTVERVGSAVNRFKVGGRVGVLKQL